MSRSGQEHLEHALALLEQVGAVDTEHPSGTLLEHLQGTYELLERWSCPEHLCLAGLYHSVYGTETFRTQTIPLNARDEVRNAIGEQAEEVAYLYCVIRRASLYANLERGAPYSVEDREGSRIPLRGVEQLADLMTLDLANRIEQLDDVRYSALVLERDRRVYERAAPLLPAAAVAALRTAFPRRSAVELAARRVLAPARRRLRRLTSRR